MTVDFNALVVLLKQSGLLDQGAPPEDALYIRFGQADQVKGSDEFTTPDGHLVKLDLGGDGELFGVEIVQWFG
jgi:uncharacterized protein YuzE